MIGFTMKIEPINTTTLTHGFMRQLLWEGILLVVLMEHVLDILVTLLVEKVIKVLGLLTMNIIGPCFLMDGVQI